jgi:hypothetical protein
VLDDQVLGDEAAHREGEDVDLVEPERRDELIGVIGSLFDGVRNLSGRGADTTLVEGDDVPVLRDGSMMRGSQLSKVAARCTKKTTGMPPFGPSSR